MRKLVLLALMAAPAVASAQSWTGGTVFPDSATSRKFNTTHGIAVDPEGKVWQMNYTQIPGDSVFSTAMGKNIHTVALYCHYPDGRPCPWSPIKSVTFSDGSTRPMGSRVNTSGTGVMSVELMTGRGLRANLDGNIMAVNGTWLTLIDYRTGQGIRWKDMGRETQVFGSLVSPGFDNLGQVYVNQVVGNNALVILNSDLTFKENVTAATPSFSRTVTASVTGDSVYWPGYTVKYLLRYRRPGMFDNFLAPDTLLRGMAIESLDWNRATGHLWASSGGTAQDFPEAPYRPGVWYAFDPRNMDVRYPARLDSIVWDVTPNVLPRAIAFDKAGTTAYVGNFAAGAPNLFGVRRYTKMTNAVDGFGRWVPDDVLLTVGPNPSRGTLNVRYRGLAGAPVRIEMFDAAGRRVASLVDGVQPDGEQTTSFDTSSLSAGTYYVRFTGGNATVTRPVSVLH